MPRHSFDAPTPETFVIPELVSDDQPVEARQLESTSSGLLGFAIPRQRAAPQRPERTTVYAPGQRRKELEDFTRLAEEAELARESQVATYGLGRHALDGAVHRQPVAPPVANTPEGFNTMER